jgi:SAM-dependent methyltransferase
MFLNFRSKLALRTADKNRTVASWLHAIGCLHRQGKLDTHTSILVVNHRLCGWKNGIRHFLPELQDSLGEWLANIPVTEKAAPGIAKEVVERIVARKTVFQCRDDHVGGGYYDAAEPYMDTQWDSLIAPYIKSMDLRKTLELAPGHGRNSEKLSHLAKELHLVDVNQTCIDFCRQRFGDSQNGCRFYYYVNDGWSLTGIRDSSVSFVYSFDSVVHFDKLVVRQYVHEFARVLIEGGTGFIHHSNYGTVKPDSDWAQNHGSRSDVTAELFASYCEEAGLKVLSQKIHGIAEGRGIDGLDCVTIFRKPAI